MTLSPIRRASELLDERADGVVVAAAGLEAWIVCDPSEPAAVHRAVAHLAEDLRRAVGAHPRVETSGAASIVVGTPGRSPMIDAAIAAGSLDLSPILDKAGVPRWEGFLIAMIDGTLFLVGADRRGAVYAVYHFAEMLGVSPWSWWGDVPVRAREHATVSPGLLVADWPSVQYRGIFVNDEEELDRWARAHTDDGTIGPQTYGRLFELILRLKGNYLWPAMHVNAFNQDPENGRLADECGIVVGSSHCDVLLRSNEHEFAPWAAQEPEPVAYDYSVPGRNRDLLLNYWRDSVEQNRPYEVTWTVGMRGIHDTGFQTATIDADAMLDAAGKTRARARLLETAIRDQRTLLHDVLRQPASDSPQIFIPYKEVLALYDEGMDLPEDVTIVWANDNYGYIRRFPNDQELRRPGGHGLYYHSSYWATPSTSYLASSSTPLALMRSELRKSWDRGIRRLWVDNVGGLKPLELETEFFLRSAWEAGKETTTDDLEQFVAGWVDAKFSGNVGAEAADVLLTYYQLNNQRKYEHLVKDVFPQTGYGDEAGRRLDRLRDLYHRANQILETLPPGERDSFFELVAVKVHMAYLTNGEFVYADRSALAFGQGRSASADRFLELSRTFDTHKRALIRYYNDVLSDGAWSGIFTPEQFPPPVMPLHPAGRPALVIAGSGAAATTWDAPSPRERPALTFSQHGTQTKWVDLFSTGVPDGLFNVETPSWIHVSPSSGQIGPETRLHARVISPEEHVGDEGTIRIDASGAEPICVSVHILPGPALAPGRPGAIEADGFVSIDPSLPDALFSTGEMRWRREPHLGRYGNDALVASAIPMPDTDSAIAEYGIHLATPGEHLLEVHRLPTLDATGRIRVAVSVDDAPRMLLESPTTDEHRGSWTSGILDNVERLRLRLPYLGAGAHTLRLHAIDSDVAVSKLVVYTHPPRPTNVGPEFSRHSHRVSADVEDDSPALVDVGELDAVARDVYRTDPASLPPLDQLYADASFWEGDTTFRLGTALPQRRHVGAAQRSASQDGAKDLLSTLGGGPAVEDDGVLAIEAEWTLAKDAGAWTSPGGDESAWTHTQAESDGGAGLAMHIDQTGARWDDPAAAPAMRFAVRIRKPGAYRTWMLVKFGGRDDDSCLLAVDGVVQPASEQFSGGDLCAYGTRQAWVWAAISDVQLTAGDHLLSVLGRESGLRVDRIYLTLGDELPPRDADWRPSRRDQQIARTDDAATALSH